jgi:hypothetical protein
VFCSQYLKFSQENGYEIYILGKNGEKKPGVTLNLAFKLYGTEEFKKI